jgi:uncharacterized protein (TIGR02453 family)
MTTKFSPDLFKFLTDLANNNEREWFQANKNRYDGSVKEPALDFIEEFAKPLAKISPHFEANARASGGSLFRIHRDTRFGADKTPYKHNTGLHFRHERAKDAHAPGFYLHLQPRQCFMGVGIWRPESKVAYQIREHIAANPAEWKKATRSAKFKGLYQLNGEALKRPPKGFDPEHKLVEDLKRKDFIAIAQLTQKQVTAANFQSDFAKMCRAGAPFMKFLCDALELKY